MGKLLGQPYKHYWDSLTSILFMEISLQNEYFEHIPGMSYSRRVRTQRIGIQLGRFIPSHRVNSNLSYPYNYQVQVVYHVGLFQKHGVKLSMLVQDSKSVSSGTRKFSCLTRNSSFSLAQWAMAQARGSKAGSQGLKIPLATIQPTYGPLQVLSSQLHLLIQIWLLHLLRCFHLV